MAYNNSIPNYEDLRAFSEVYLRAIALAWEDNDTGRKFAKLFSDQPKRALEEYFNYKTPWAVNLKIRTVKEEKGKVGWDPELPKGGGWRLPNNKIKYGVPLSPGAQGLSEPIGLAAYADGGRTYLFTCC